MILHLVGPAPGALEAPGIAREVAEAGHPVQVMLEPHARGFVGPAAFEGRLVDEQTEAPEAAIFAPATAGTIARLAHGLDDDYGARLAVVVPDLDAGTANHPAVGENLTLLRERGFLVVDSPDGTMAPAGEVVAAVVGGLGGPMGGLHVVVTAGGTHEPIDSVRYIGNRSSGKMGLAIAHEALRLGARVTVVAANVAKREPGAQTHDVETVEELRSEVLDLASGADALVMAAAVSDFAPASPAGEKIRRGESGLSLELVPTADILKAVRERYPELFVVGFAATHGDPVADARAKLESKGVNLVVGNDISRAGLGFGSDENEVHIVGRGDERFVPRATKREIARAILEGLLTEMGKERQG